MLLDLRNVTKTFRGPHGKIHALDRVSLSIDSGEFVCVQGPSGCGKTTLLLTAGGLLTPDGGEIRLDGQDPYVFSPNRRAEFRAKTVGFVFQQFHLIPYLSVRDNVAVPSLAHPAAETWERADELLSRLGLAERIDHLPSKLSTGERQRVALARALLNRPRLLLADEPTGNLDRSNADVVLQSLEEFSKEGGGVLLVTHDEHASRQAQRCLRIREGRLEGPPVAEPAETG